MERVKRHLVAIVAVFAVGVLFAAVPPPAPPSTTADVRELALPDGAQRAPHHPSRILVRLRETVTASSRESALAAVAGSRVVRDLRAVSGLSLVEVPDGEVETAVAALSRDPNVIYATIELGARKGGFWRSTDAGGSWEKRSDYLSGGTGPHYYQEIFASPHKLDRVYQMDATLHITDDGGKNFVPQPMGHRHSDHHAMAFDPDDPDYVMYGTDGGLYESFDGGATFRYVANLPITQFYKVAVDYDEPFYNLYGGTQDNSTQGGPSRTMNVNGIRNSDWFITVFADGH